MNDLDEGVPIPEAKKRYHFEQWKVGDSKYYDHLAEVERVANAARAYAKRHNQKFKATYRAIESGGYRIWRIS